MINKLNSIHKLFKKISKFCKIKNQISLLNYQLKNKIIQILIQINMKICIKKNNMRMLIINIQVNKIIIMNICKDVNNKQNL